MDIRLIALDLDGTLLDDQKRLSPANRSILDWCIGQGIEIVPATGRPAGGIPDIVKNIPGVRYAISLNGAKVADLKENRIIAENLIDADLSLRIAEYLSHFPVAFDPYIEGRGKMEPRFRNHLADYGIPDTIQRLIWQTRDEVADELETIRSWNRPVEKFNLFTDDRALRARLWEELKQWKELVVTSSFDFNLEINAASATKGGGLLCLAEHLGLKLEQTMAFGDGSNDLSMILQSGMGIAMENAMDLLKEQADFITRSNEEDGVAYAIEKFLKNRNS